MRRRRAVRMPRGVMRNLKPSEALKPGSQQRAAPNINVMRFRCDEPKAKLRRGFFMRQEPAFSRRMRDDERCCGRHGLAEKFPQICHAAVRLDSYAALSRAISNSNLVRTSAGPIGPVLTRVREMLNPWLREPQFVQSEIAPKLKYSVEAEDNTSPAPIRLKIEINTRERVAYDTPQALPFSVENPWFTGTADIPTFSNEELLSTKVRALLQRNKGRDLIDIAHALDIFEDFDAAKTVEVLGKYLTATGISISREEAERRMFSKLNNPNFMADVRPLLSADEAESFDENASKTAFVEVFDKIIRFMPGKAWQQTEEMTEKFGLIGLGK